MTHNTWKVLGIIEYSECTSPIDIGAFIRQHCSTILVQCVDARILRISVFSAFPYHRQAIEHEHDAHAFRLRMRSSDKSNRTGFGILLHSTALNVQRVYVFVYIDGFVWSGTRVRPV